jgi:Putative polyhydroxyalkanoic acid system protein (PHA_gran_rgn)
MKHVIQHDLDMPTARRVVDHAFAEYQARFPDYKPTLEWESDTHATCSFNAKGIKLAGSMTVEPTSIVMDLDVPFLFRPFQKVAIKVIDDEVRRWIGKAHAGEL